MNSIKLTVKSSTFHIDIELFRRFNIIKGDSGVGKSTLVEVLSDYGSPDVDIFCELKIVIVNLTDWQVVMSAAKNALIVIDDMDFVETSEFNLLYQSTCIQNNNYYLVIAREVISNFKGLSRLPFSINAVYKMEKNGIFHSLYPYYTDLCYADNPDCVIVEDSGSGYDFFKWLVSDGIAVETARSGNSSIIADTEQLLNKYHHVFVIFDTASFGCYMDEFYLKFTNIYPNNIISYMSEYECFEELLIRTNLINHLEIVRKELPLLFDYANQEISWERYFEDLLRRATYDKVFKQRHGMKLNQCFYIDCKDCNPYLKDKCKFVLDGNKFKALLSDTRYECLLGFGREK